MTASLHLEFGAVPLIWYASTSYCTINLTLTPYGVGSSFYCTPIGVFGEPVLCFGIGSLATLRCSDFRFWHRTGGLYSMSNGLVEFLIEWVLTFPKGSTLGRVTLLYTELLGPCLCR